MKKNVGLFVTIGVLVLVLLIIIPLPPLILDIMFVINIGLSFAILLTTMYIKKALEFSIFPSMLLVTTIFRLALNISSTRLILLNGGEAGEIIKTFGDFVLGGDAVVGFIIFIIIVIIQFLVITKGSERVAEVAARFTLDAMPGKQMSIDADLNTGAITEDEARNRRLDVQREADFFGSMDGATKFVKGDAIASIVITLINLIAGIVIGTVSGGMEFGDVLTKYSIATVGDGMVSQLPALLISIATGMIVTRSASKSDFSNEVLRQFSSRPAVLAIAGVAVMSLMLFSFPPLPLIIIGGALLILSYVASKKKEEPVTDAVVPNQEDEMVEVSESEFYRNIDNIYALINVNPVEVEFGYSLVPMVDEKLGGGFIDRVVMFRRQFATEMGVVVPSVRVRDSSVINPNQYIIRLKGEQVAMGEVLTDYFLALDPGNTTGEVDGIDTIEPAYGIPGRWITSELRETAEIFGYSVIDPLSVVITHLTEVVRKNIHELLSRQDIQMLLENVKKQNELIVNELIPNVLTLADLQKVLSNLLKEGVPIKDMETILETMGDYIPNVKDTDMLTEYVRQALKRTITQKFAEEGQLKVITVDAEIEKIILGGIKKNEHGSYMAIDPDVIQSIMTNFLEQVDRVQDIITYPVVLTSPVVRIYFKKIADQFSSNTVVLSFSEIDNTVQIQAIGEVSLTKV